MIPIIYYAHSMLIYDTPREQEELRLLHEYFQDGVIYNPNRPYIQQSDNPMKTCCEIVKDPWIVGVAFSHSFRMISSGVYVEIKIAQKYQKPLFLIEQNGIYPYCGFLTFVGKDKREQWARV